MEIQGLQKMTLLDYPGRVACTVFLGGCDLRCPFCHNGGLVLEAAPPQLDSGELLSFLKKRVGLLDGVCITGAKYPLQNARLVPDATLGASNETLPGGAEVRRAFQFHRQTRFPQTDFCGSDGIVPSAPLQPGCLRFQSQSGGWALLQPLRRRLLMSNPPSTPFQNQSGRRRFALRLQTPDPKFLSFPFQSGELPQSEHSFRHSFGASVIIKNLPAVMLSCTDSVASFSVPVSVLGRVLVSCGL